MKVTYEKIVRANNPLDKLRDERMSNESASKLFLLKKVLATPFEFYSDREKTLCAQSGGKLNGNTLLFGKGMDDQRIKFVNGMNELNAMETEVDWDPCIISDDIPMSWGIACDLSEFVSFERGE